MDFFVGKALVLNLSFNSYVKLCLLDDVEPYSETSFRQKSRALQSVVLSHYEEILDKNLTNLSGKSIIVSIDTRWSARGYTANESTTSFFIFNELQQNYTLLYTFSCMKRGIYNNYRGSSKNMESFGTEEILKILIEKNIKISVFIHDADACTTLIVRKYYPESKEYIDKLHKQRSVRRRLYDLEEKTLKKRDWIERALKCSSLMLYKFQNSVESKKIHLNTKVNHWQNNHEQCDLKEECKISYIPLHIDQTHLLRTILNSIVTDHDKLSHSYHTNSNESFNSSLLSFCPKNINQASLYKYKIARAGLVSLFKSNADLKILEMLDFKIKERFRVAMMRIERRMKYIQAYQKSDTFKANRRKRLLAKRKMSLVSTTDGSYGLVLSYCSCKGGKRYASCSTRRCKCTQNNLKCNEKCKCKGKCEQKLSTNY